jgi:hypothetical protein
MSQSSLRESMNKNNQSNKNQLSVRAIVRSLFFELNKENLKKSYVLL